MNRSFKNKATMIANLQQEVAQIVNNEMMDYTNRIMMVAEIKQEIEMYTSTNSDVENDSILVSKNHVNVANRMLLCIENLAYLYKRRALSNAELRRILLESNSAFIIRRDGRNNKRKIKKKKINTVPDRVLQAILDGGAEAMPAV